MSITELRNADLQTLVATLQDESARRHDVVAPAGAIRMADDGTVNLSHVVPAEIHADGVSPERTVTANLSTTVVAEEQLGERLGIPRAYFKRCSEEATGLLAQNVNHWLGQDDRSFYLRTLTAGPDDGGTGLLRAVMSDRFRPIDNIDVLTACLAGVRGADIDPSTVQIGSDLSLRRMYVRITAPAVAVEAMDLAERYVDPRSGRTGRDFPLVSAGVVITNSDVGQGAFKVTPRFVWQVCTNGMTRTQDAQRQIHIGGKHDEGVVDWSEETVKRQLALISSITTDAVKLFLTPEYLEGVMAEMRGMSRKPVTDPIAAVQTVTKKLGYGKDEAALILNAFVTSGDLTPLGMAQAFTLTAQSDEVSIDRASDMETDAWQAMTLAAAI